MKNFVPINKMTKKQQKAYYDGQRQTWNGLNPVTRSVPNGKAYSRKKLKNTDRRNGRLSIHQDDLPFL